MKKFNLAALPLAVAGVLASSAALAGTEACFEVYRVAAAVAGNDDAEIAAVATAQTTYDNAVAAYQVAGGTEFDAAATAQTAYTDAVAAYQTTGGTEFDALAAVQTTGGTEYDAWVGGGSQALGTDGTLETLNTAIAAAQATYNSGLAAIQTTGGTEFDALIAANLAYSNGLAAIQTTGGTEFDALASAQVALATATATTEAGVVTNHDVLYTPASCVSENNRTGATATNLAATVNGTIAWELTGDVDVDFENLGDAAVTPRHHIVYIPTSQLSSSARVTMELTGADFGSDNDNQIFLILKDGNGDYQSVATSDGNFEGETEITFIVGNDPIPAGSRLLLSSINVSDQPEDDALVAGINIHIANEETCAITPMVTIAATSALSDALQVINGAISGSPQEILNISEQFSMLFTAPAVSFNDANSILVNAEDPSFRTQFVNNGQANGNWNNQVTADSAFWEAKFVNRFDTIDQFVTLDPSDTVTVTASADAATGSGVEFSLLTANNNATDAADFSVLDTTEADYLSDATGREASLVNLTGDDTVSLSATPTDHVANASNYFQQVNNVVSVTNGVARLTNTIDIPNGIDGVMGFNYNVNTVWSMNFNDSTMLDKNSCYSPVPFTVGVNGAVLKVPYVYTKANEGGFVRITSEHNTESLIFMDIFDEDSHEMKNVAVGAVAMKASKVLKADDLLQLAIDAGYDGTGDRHTMTFTVTGPSDAIHGVSVQKIAGGVDRVMPVLDQNSWDQ